MGLLQRTSEYSAADDPLVAATNRIALLVASSQPFYPLYVWYAAGSEAALVSLYTWHSTPFLLAVPWLAKHDSRAGRALMILAGAGNTFMSAKIFGTGSAVELFLAPCAMLCALSFRRNEMWIAGALLACGLAVFALLQKIYGAPLVLLSDTQAESLRMLNIYSVAGLTACIAWTFSGASSRDEHKGL